MITVYDWILLPVLLALIFTVASYVRDRLYAPGHPYRPYFMAGLFCKIIGALFITIIYVYYYGYGDMLIYYRESAVINSSFGSQFPTWVKLVTYNPNWFESDLYAVVSRMTASYYYNTANYSVCIAAALLGLFVGSTFLPTAVLFAVLSFTGVWALFRTFATRYPNQLPLVATAILFFPSVIVWGSGITKDTLCLFALGWLTHGVFKILIERKNIVKNAFVIFLSCFIIYKIKLYILLALLPALTFWVLSTNSKKIGNKFVSYSTYIVIPAILVLITSVFSTTLTSQIKGYSLENISETSEKVRTHLYEESVASGGSAYSLGAIDNSATGMLKAAPAAINVTLYRPYPWEARNVIMLLNALESLVLFLLTVYVAVQLGVSRIAKLIRKSPDLQFFLLFTLVFAFATGISTSNFGTLSRYKIPCLPFFGLFLALLLVEARAAKGSRFMRSAEKESDSWLL